MYKDIVTDIFFDLDHTLWDFEKNSALTFERLLVDFEVSISLDIFLEAYIPINLKYWRMYRNGEVSKETLRYERLKYTFDQLSYNATDRLIHDMADQYMEVLTTYNHLFPGTPRSAELSTAQLQASYHHQWVYGSPRKKNEKFSD